MKKVFILCGVVLIAALLAGPAIAQDEGTLHIVKTDVNAESENAELCLEFDKTLAAATPTHLAAALHLEAGGKTVAVPNIAATGTSLCLFPLERGVPYHLEVAGLHGANEEKMAATYKMSFAIPDRSPALAFTGRNGGVNGFDFYDNPLTLRAVNVAHAKIEIYRITDPAAEARAWQDRAQTALAPSESAYLAHSKGEKVWQGENIFGNSPNVTAEQKIDLREKAPNLASGLYLIVADASDNDAKPANKGLTPLAAAWFTKADFSLRALRDDNGIHVFAAQTDTPGAKTDIRLIAMNRKPEALAEMQIGTDGVGLIPYPANLADKNDMASIVGIGKDGSVAFADIEDLPQLSSRPAWGIIRPTTLLAAPGEATGVSLSLVMPENANALTVPSVLRVSQGESIYTEFTVPAPNQGNVKWSFSAPVPQGIWCLRWQKTDGTLLAKGNLRISSNANAPHLEVTSQRDSLTSDGNWPVTIKSLAVSGKPEPLVSGHISVTWQNLDPNSFGWKDYRFGTETAILDTPAAVADFLTDLEGDTQAFLTLPKPPQERGLYQAVMKVVADTDTGVAEAPPLTLPLRPDTAVIGIKPLAADARFPQNGIARFALIALSSDGKPRDMPGLSYQVYEEGRNFEWYQDEGRWKYKPEPQLRPIGGGALSIKSDAGNILEWPVTAGNYRLEVLDPSGKTLAQLAFSASWDSAGASAAPLLPLALQLPKNLQPGREAIAHLNLPQPAMLTAIIADTRIRKIIHEFHNKGDTTIAFTPGADWPDRINLSVEAISQNNQNIPMRATVEASINQGKAANSDNAGTAGTVDVIDDPSALVLHKDGMATLSFRLENRGATSEVYHYAFTASPGLKIEGGDKGSVAVGSEQSLPLSLLVSGAQAGIKELRLEVTSTHTPKLSRNWAVAVLSKADALRSDASISIAPKQPFLVANTKQRSISGETSIFVSRHPMSGLAEILSDVFNARPFTTTELALSIDALRQWDQVLDQAGFAPDFLIKAKRQEMFFQLLQHQNADGGFAAWRGGESTIEDTAAALTALGPENSDVLRPVKTLAIGWIKQRLANTWVDEKERAPRAAAYAALAAADAIDTSSLHYFSDTSAATVLPPIAEANIAAAFKHIRDPNAAAFWIKKMLDENSGSKSISLLNALAATDALSSDDVQAALTDMTNAMRHGSTPSITDAAALLRAIAADNADAGRWKLTNGSETREVSGVLALHASDATLWRNGNGEPLSATTVTESQNPRPTSMRGVSIERHIYRLNGVEISPPVRPTRDEIYMIELKGTARAANENERVLVQNGGSNALRPIGCALSSKLDTPAFIPWFSPQGLTPIFACEFSAHDINAVLTSTEDESDAFRIVYFARVDAGSLADIPLPRVRILK